MNITTESVLVVVDQLMCHSMSLQARYEGTVTGLNDGTASHVVCARDVVVVREAGDTLIATSATPPFPVRRASY
jgi:hypothetical protein